MTKQPAEGVAAFADVIQRRRKAARLSRRQLARQAGVHQTYVGMLERQIHIPTLLSAFAIAEGLGIPLSKLIAQAERVRRLKRRQQS